jgi:hypothetical protein
MYWLCKARNQDEEGTVGVTLSESEAERWLNVFVRSGFCPDQIWIESRNDLRKSIDTSDNHKRSRLVHTVVKSSSR